MTEDIPLEITSSDMANLPIFIAVLIVATVVVRVYFSIKHNGKAAHCPRLLVRDAPHPARHGSCMDYESIARK